MQQRLNPRRRFWAGLPLLAVLLAAGGASAQSRGISYISTINGRAEVNGSPAYVGDFVGPSTRLRVPSGGSVGIVCHNETRERRFGAGTYTLGDYCSTSRSSSRGRRRPSRSFDANLPYIVSPRNTGLLSAASLRFAWQGVEAESYTVVLYRSRPTAPDWRAQVQGTSIVYDGPPLATDTRYRLEVTADNGLSSAADMPVGFTLLSEGEVERVEAAIATLQALELTPDAAAIGTALIYQGYRHSDLDLDTRSPLYAAALETLQQRIDAGTDNSAIYLMQADIYLATGLPLRAQERYQQALDLAVATGQLRRQAASLEGLGLVATGDSQLQAARTYLEAAIEIYQRLGDEEAAENLKNLIDILG